jgi:hypothetical protein
MTKNSSFLCFRVVFMSYCPQFWGSREIYKAHDTRVHSSPTEKPPGSPRTFSTVPNQQPSRQAMTALVPFLFPFSLELDLGSQKLSRSLESKRESKCLMWLGRKAAYKSSSSLAKRVTVRCSWNNILGSWERIKKIGHLHVWVTWPKTHHFCVYGRFCELLPIVFGLRGDFQGPWHCTCLSGMTKNSSFLHFRAIFMRYCPQFWGSRVIYKAHDT